MESAKEHLSRDDFDRLRQRLAQDGRLGFKIATDSMVPLIPVRDLIIVAPLTAEPSRFDLLVFWGGDRLICHYLWHVNWLAPKGEARTYITRNLKYGGEDLPFDSSRILGRVISHQLGRGWRAHIVLRQLWRRLRG